MDLKIQKDLLLPDWRVGATYDVNSIGNRLDGPNTADQVNAFRNLSSDHFNNWSVQTRLNVSLGYRLANANVRAAQLRLARAYGTLVDSEQKTISFLELQYRRVIVAYELIRANRASRVAFGQQLKARFDELNAGRITPDKVLEVQRFWANALAQEYIAIRDYNNALAGFEFAKGTILTRNNIVISEGPLPGFAQKRAVEHIRERDAALNLRERPSPVALGDAGLAMPGCNSAMEGSAPSLPELYRQVPPLKKETPDNLVLPLPNDLGKASTLPATPVPALPTPPAMPAVLPAPTTTAPTPAAKETFPSLSTTRPSDFGAIRPPSDGLAPLPAVTSPKQ
jgi:hypothetical protein